MKEGDKVRVIMDVPYKGFEGIIRREIKKQYWICLNGVTGNKWFYGDELEVIK